MCVCVGTCAHGCVCACMHEGVRLIEVVRVKMIPSGGDIAGGGGGWAGSAAGDGERSAESNAMES